MLVRCPKPAIWDTKEFVTERLLATTTKCFKHDAAKSDRREHRGHSDDEGREKECVLGVEDHDELQFGTAPRGGV